MKSVLIGLVKFLITRVYTLGSIFLYILLLFLLAEKYETYIFKGFFLFDVEKEYEILKHILSLTASSFSLSFIWHMFNLHYAPNEEK